MFTLDVRSPVTAKSQERLPIIKIHSCWVDFVMSLGVRAFQPLALSASLVSASRETCAMREHLSAEREA